MADGFKTEDGAHIKPDPAGTAESKMMDEDQYEDTGELKIDESMEQCGAWLAKVPTWLWESWSKIAEKDEIMLGEVRVYKKKPGEENAPDKIKIVLNDIPGHKDLPKKYNITINKSFYNNAVVFSEQDQPGYKAGAWNRDKRVPQTRDFKQEPYRVSKKPYRSSIPKQTALRGYLKHEVNVTAVENKDFLDLMRARNQALIKPKHTTTYQTGIDSAMHPGLAANKGFATFVSNTKASAKGKKSQQEKAVRISENDLLDALQQCFREYRYWSLRALRLRLKQPEAFIRSNLDKIGELVRSGRFAGNWKLTENYEQTVRGDANVKEELANEEGASEDEGEDDFEDVKMEDY